MYLYSRECGKAGTAFSTNLFTRWPASFFIITKAFIVPPIFKAGTPVGFGIFMVSHYKGKRNAGFTQFVVSFLLWRVERSETVFLYITGREALVKKESLQAPLASFFALPAKLVEMALLWPASACALTFYCETIKKSWAKRDCFFVHWAGRANSPYPPAHQLFIVKQ